MSAKIQKLDINSPGEAVDSRHSQIPFVEIQQFNPCGQKQGRHLKKLFTEALFLIGKRLDQPNCPSLEVQVNHLWQIHLKKHYTFFVCFLFVVYGSSQARGQIGGAVASPHHSPNNTGSQPHLQPTLHLVAMLNP